MDDFQAGLQFVLAREGGFVDDPADHGGATNRGITQKTYDVYRKNRALPLQSVRFISTPEINDIYRGGYWIPCRCDDLPTDTAIATFDCCVNCGPHQAGVQLQRALRIPADGIIGSHTVAEAVAAEDRGGVCADLFEERRAYYRYLVAKDPTQKRFLQGWLNRVDELAEYLDNLQA